MNGFSISSVPSVGETSITAVPLQTCNANIVSINLLHFFSLGKLIHIQENNQQFTHPNGLGLCLLLKVVTSDMGGSDGFWVKTHFLMVNWFS